MTSWCCVHKRGKRKEWLRHDFVGSLYLTFHLEMITKLDYRSLVIEIPPSTSSIAIDKGCCASLPAGQWTTWYWAAGRESSWVYAQYFQQLMKRSRNRWFNCRAKKRKRMKKVETIEACWSTLLIHRPFPDALALLLPGSLWSAGSNAKFPSSGEASEIPDQTAAGHERGWTHAMAWTVLSTSQCALQKFLQILGLQDQGNTRRAAAEAIYRLTSLAAEEAGAFEPCVGILG